MNSSISSFNFRELTVIAIPLTSNLIHEDTVERSISREQLSRLELHLGKKLRCFTKCEADDFAIWGIEQDEVQTLSREGIHPLHGEYPTEAVFTASNAGENGDGIYHEKGVLRISWRERWRIDEVLGAYGEGKVFLVVDEK